MYRYPLAYDVLMLSNEHRNKILRCKHIPWITVVFCWRKCNIKRRHPGDPRSYRSVGISQSQCRREGEFRMHHQAPDYGKKNGELESHPVILFASGRDEVMSSGKTKSFIFLNNKYGRKVQTWVWILFFFVILDCFFEAICKKWRFHYYEDSTKRGEVSVFNR